MPKEGAKPTVSAQISSAEEPAIFVQPLQAIPLTDVPKSTEADPGRPSQKGDVSQGPEANLARPPRMWPKRDRRSRGSGQLLYLFLV